MKKFLFASLVLFLSFMMTGCVKCTYDIEINDKGNIKFTQIQAINTGVLKSFNPEIDSEIEKSFEESKSDLEKDGTKADFYQDDDYAGVKLTKETQLETLQAKDLPDGFYPVTDPDDKTEELPVFSKDKQFFKTVYALDMMFDGKKAQEAAKKKNEELMKQKTGEQTSETEVQNEQTSSVTVQENGENPLENAIKPVYELSITIPKKASEHNATSALSETQYKWVLSAKNPTRVTIKYENTNWLNIICLIICLILFGLIAGKYFQSSDKLSGW